MNKSIPVVILCGGEGTRLRQETEFRPKPLVEIGEKPILWHIMTLYSSFGFNNFILCLGYKGEMIKDYFLNYEYMRNNLVVQLGRKSKVDIIGASGFSDPFPPWRITLIDTGEKAMTGARVGRIAKYIDADDFMLTYGDGVGNIDIHALLKYHRQHGKIGTVTGVRPPSRFGELVVERNKVVEFSEKPQIQQGYINGGYFVFKREFLDYVSDQEDLVLERQPLEQLARKNELMIHSHEGFWHCMDTFRDYKALNELWARGNAPWLTRTPEKTRARPR